MTSLKRNAGHTSLRAASTWLGGVVTPPSIAAWEHKTGTSFLVESIDLFNMNEDRWASQSSGYACAAMRYRADASNANVYRGYSIQALEVSASYVFGPSPEDVSRHVVWSDSQIIVDKTGAGCLELTRKQVDATGCPMYTPPPASFTIPRRERWVIAVTDDGGDCKFARGQLSLTCANSTCCYFVELGCLHHAQSNGSKKVLCATDRLSTVAWALRYSYFSALAKLSNLIRLRFAQIQRAWARRYGVDYPEAFAKTCPKPIGTRWGSVFDCEAYLLRLPQHAVVQLFSELFGDDERDTCRMQAKKQKHVWATHVATFFLTTWPWIILLM